MKKYKIDYENKIRYKGRTLYRIIALRDFSDVMKGDKGGYVESEQNLSQDGDCWIYDEAKAMDDSRVENDARMHYRSEIQDRAKMCGNSRMYSNAMMFDDSELQDYAEMHHKSLLYGFAKVCNSSKLMDMAKVGSISRICGNSILTDMNEI